MFAVAWRAMASSLVSRGCFRLGAGSEGGGTPFFFFFLRTEERLPFLRAKSPYYDMFLNLKTLRDRLL